jgi:hypothetical protein
MNCFKFQISFSRIRRSEDPTVLVVDRQKPWRRHDPTIDDVRRRLEVVSTNVADQSETRSRQIGGGKRHSQTTAARASPRKSVLQFVQVFNWQLQAVCLFGLQTVDRASLVASFGKKIFIEGSHKAFIHSFLISLLIFSIIFLTFS